MLDLIKATLQRIYSLYRDFPRKLFELSVYVSFASVALGLVSGLILAWIVWKFELLPAQYFNGDFGDFAVYTFFWDGVERVTSFVLLGYGLFAVRMRAEGERAIAERSFSSIWAGITAKNWSTFLISWIVLFVLQLAFFKAPFDSAGDGLGNLSFSRTDGDMGTSALVRYAAWANAVIKLLLSYLPYGLVLYMLLADRNVPLHGHTFRKYSKVIGAMLLIGFTIDALFNMSYYYFDTYILPPFTIPFDASALSGVFRFMVTLLITAWTFPGVALCLLGPLDEHERTSDKSVLTETAEQY